MTFEDELQAQNDHLRQQIAALHSLPAKRLREYQLFLLHCQCGEVLLELLDTRPYWSLRFRQTEHGSVSLPPTGATSAERKARWAEHFANEKRSIRRDRHWRFFPLLPTTDLADDEATQVIGLDCKCSSGQQVTLAWVLDQVRTENRRDTLK